ncbi:Hypothetical protein SCLAV_0666 [Streptomyces clavuligerus]|uniref:Uncharacterized protein n=1 Tax=Streptomyces clavuligerus TaxID=1901 RepID=E2PUC3_STRCL|nr:Hypothetical protein SCLAV_0666 [Streptomyces clavuligerus]
MPIVCSTGGRWQRGFRGRTRIHHRFPFRFPRTENGPDLWKEPGEGT